MEGGRRRITLYDQMLAVGDGRELAGGLTLNDVLTIHKRGSPSPSPAVRLNSRTLLDIIRDDVGKLAAGNKEKKSWKFLRDRLRLNLRSQVQSPNSLRFASFSSAEMTPNEDQSPESATAVPPIRQILRRNSTRFNQNAPPSSEATNSEHSPENNNSASAGGGGGRSLLRPQMSRHNSTRFSVQRSESFTDLTDPARDGTRRLSAALAEERSLSAREAVAAQEAADAEATANEEEEEEEEEEDEEADSGAAETAEPVRMSLMDLLEETDRQMGFEGSRYRIEDVEEEEEVEEEEKNEVTAVCGGGSERNCCVCMVRHKGAAFIPCGHTFCRLCSRELWVSRGNCPLCNGFILEILDIF